MLNWISRFLPTPLVYRLIASLLLCNLASALDPNRAIGEAHFDHWGTKQGFPGGAVNAIAQTIDGYLWIGSQNGLVRFDGQRFALWNQESRIPFPGVPVLGLRADRKGSLWIRLHSPGLYRYHDGRFDGMLQNASDFTGVTALGTGMEGDVLLARSGDPVRYQDGVLSHLVPSGAAGQLAIAIEETPDKTLWIGTRDAGLLGYRNGQPFKLGGLPDRKVNCLLRGEGGRLWIGTDSGLTQWTGAELRHPPMPEPLSRIPVLSLAADHDGNVWIGTTRGLGRLNKQGYISEESFGDAWRTPVNTVFEDREGNLWVGRSNGIERYREAHFRSYPIDSAYEAENAGPLCLDSKGRLWFGPSSGGLSWLAGDRQSTFSGAGLPHDVVYSIASGPGEDLWVGRQKGGLTHLFERNGSFVSQTLTTRNGLAKGPVYVVHRGRDGSIWAGTGNGAVSRLKNGRITTFTGSSALASHAITAIEETRNGSVWVATLDGLMSFTNGIWRIYSGESGLPPARINCLFVDANDVLWIGTEAGLAFSKDGRTITSPQLPDKLQGNIFGIVDDRLGYLWLAAEHSVIRVSRAALMNAVSEGAGEFRQFDVLDGLPGTDGVRRDHTLLKDGTGRIWLSFEGGIATVDPARIPSQSLPALVHVEEVIVNGRGLPLENRLHIPPSQQRIEFSYVGLSLGAPDNVQYRYRLDGFDREWSTASNSRRAVYTNLTPGAYCFRVISSNSEGIWNSAEAKSVFQIDPQIWQTFWFQSVVLLFSTFALIGFYRLRLRQLTKQLNSRFEERLAERTRIARELHDTLLQSLHGVMFRFQAARNMLPRRPEEAMTALDGAIERTEQAIVESRDAIKDLRAETPAERDLAESITHMVQELMKVREGDEQKPEWSMTVEGQVRPIAPMIRHEILQIAHEVLANAFSHAAARRIEAEVRFSRKDLRLRFRDDGVGIDPAVLKQGRRPGHWGLPGVRERAERISANLDFWSESGAGTEVQLMVPAEAAYQRSRDHSRWRLGGRKRRDS